LPFFIQWLTEEHPSNDGKAVSKIIRINLAKELQLNKSWFMKEINLGLGDIKVERENSDVNQILGGIISVEFEYCGNKIILD
jgi:hypothetical protein